VTKFTYKTIPQGQVWVSSSASSYSILSPGSCLIAGLGRTRNYTADQPDAAKSATIKFQQKKDTKAALNLVTFYTPIGVRLRDVDNIPT
jgi:hypothetical protein